MKDLFDAIDANRERYIEELIDLLRRPSVSYTGEGIGECAEHLRGWLEGWGADARVVPTKGHPVVLGKIGPEAPRRTVLLYGHYDVKQPGDRSEWDSDPFGPVVKEGALYARGSADNKGQLFANALAVRLLHEAGRLNVGVTFLFEGEEEVGSLSLRAFAEEHREELKADLLYGSDGPRHLSDRPTVHLGFRGVLKLRLRVENEVGAHVHSGNYGEIVRNPAWDLVHLLHTMKSPEGEVLIPGFYDEAALPSALERKALATIPDVDEEIRRELGVRALFGPDDLSTDEKILFRPTFTIDGFRCGMESTIIPGHATAYIDIRLVKNMTPLGTFEKVKKHLDAQGVPGASVSIYTTYPPTKTPVDHPFVQTIFGAFERMHAEGALEAPPVLMPAFGGSLGNDVFTETLGLPAIWAPYAQPNNGQHGPNEHLRIDHFLAGVKMGAAALTALGS